MEWFFDGLGTELISVIIGIIFGAVTGGTISNTKIRQEQKAKNEASQIQIGRIKDNE